ncbi:glycosyltransferase family 39 protein [Candidatus Curtissbacteria bacterium]|nr:glycosyltransferase family 39 protein [Candidatus Curtissbacteria bacterium]
MRKYLLLAIILLAAILRFYKLGSTPPSLYWDEASLGYNAYSILKTGRDEHGKFLPTTNFAAFGDYKPPGYIYTTVPSIAIFGLTEFAIRFPSALFGTLTVLLTYLLAKKLFGESQNGWREWKGPRQRAASNFFFRTARKLQSIFLKTETDLTKNTSTKVRASTGGPPKASLAFSGREKADRTRSELIALLAAFFLAISPSLAPAIFPRRL